MSSQNLSANELREIFLSFFEEKGHKRLPSSSLIPENDPTVLFTTAGMHPLVPYLLGEAHPLGKRLCDVQKCLRTDDIEEVGDSQHLTFFEMLGYWSLGDYFKKESIRYTWEFYIEVLGFNKDDISVTVFAGDETAPFDQESFDTWKNEIGIPEERIYKYSKKENWWGPVGEAGPCGPDTEMFIDTGLEKCSADCGPSCHCDKFVEIGNNVFMEYNKTAEGKFEKLKQKNVDVGLGFERLVMIVQNKNDVFETDLFGPIIKKIEDLSGMEYGEKTDEEYIKEGKQCWVDVRRQMRIIADHVRAATFAIADGAVPSNKGAGYVVRRLIRRAIIQGKQLGIEKNFCEDLALVISTGAEKSLNLISRQARDDIKNELEKEEAKFRETLERGLEKLEIQLKLEESRPKSERNLTTISGMVTDLKQSHGFPIETSIEFLNRKNDFDESEIKFIVNVVSENEKKHQELSRTASAGMFKGGLADNKVDTTRLHTAAHLLLAALRHELGEETEQKGSNITEERLRFDFNYPEKLSEEQIKKIEDLVNLKIEEALPVVMQELSLEEAKNSGATGSFHDKYGDTVKIFTVGDPAEPFSREICGGPHVTNTSELGHFCIIKEESSSAGVRRVKAILS